MPDPLMRAGRVSGALACGRHAVAPHHSESQGGQTRCKAQLSAVPCRAVTCHAILPLPCADARDANENAERDGDERS
jgi:hypothetical protein